MCDKRFIMISSKFVPWTLFLHSSERRNNCLALLESALGWLKKLSIFVFSQNHKMRISEAPDSKIFPNF